MPDAKTKESKSKRGRIAQGSLVVVPLLLVFAAATYGDAPRFGWIWPAIAIALLASAAALGRASKLGWFGILLDTRERYSLTRLQLVLWTLVVLSLVASVALLRLLAGEDDALGFAIADELLIMMGVSLGSTVLSTVAKASHDEDFAEQVAASSVDTENETLKPRWTQLFLHDEGAGADKIVDLAKFQNLLLTIVVVITYCASVVAEIGVTASSTTVIPGFSQTLLVFVAVSHAGYLAGKLPPPNGKPTRGETLAAKNRRLNPEE